MTLTLEIEPEIESLLKKRPKADGCDVPDYVRNLIKRDVTRQPTFDEILAPFREAVYKSGISNEELDSLFTEARKEAQALLQDLSGQSGGQKQCKALIE